MQLNNKKNIKEMIAIFAIALIVLISNSFARPVSDIVPPDLPAACGSIQVPAGNEAIFHAYAIGVQIYRWNGSAWVFVAPSANLFADAGYNGKVGFHYAGPTWESNSGSKVVGAVIDRCPGPDVNAIPWLILGGASSTGPGVFDGTNYIQRVNTAGGKAPAAPGATVGEIARVPYTAEYFFYRPL